MVFTSDREITSGHVPRRIFEQISDLCDADRKAVSRLMGPKQVDDSAAVIAGSRLRPGHDSERVADRRGDGEGLRAVADYGRDGINGYHWCAKITL